MKKRVITGTVAIVTVVCFLILQTILPTFFDIFILAVSIIGVYEVSKLFEKAGKPNYSIIGLIFAFLAFVMVSVCIIFNLNAVVLFIMYVGSLIVAFALMYFIPLIFKNKMLTNNTFRVSTGMKESEFALFKAYNTASLFVYPLFLAFFMYYLNHIHQLGFLNITAAFKNANIALFGLVLAIFLTVFTDTFAYIFGSLIKGPKLCPKISPKKTISGAVFGLLGGVVAAVVVLAIFKAIYAPYAAIKYWQIILVAMFGSALGQVGDLFESYLKRKACVKDSGNILPGHGGVMDRVDAMLFVIPFIFICLILILA